MLSEDHRFEAAVSAIDDANSDDPNEVFVDGVAKPRELLHAELMTSWVQKLDPAATEAQLLAARAHHLRRWTVPRSSFPDGRSGYLRWRNLLAKTQAEEVAGILARCGYEQETIDRVSQIVAKENRDIDPQVQTHEDALCLTFLQTRFIELAERMDETKMVDILAKTLEKMSSRGRDEALGLSLAPEASRLLEQALRGSWPLQP